MPTYPYIESVFSKLDPTSYTKKKKSADKIGVFLNITSILPDSVIKLVCNPRLVPHDLAYEIAQREAELYNSQRIVSGSRRPVMYTCDRYAPLIIELLADSAYVLGYLLHLHTSYAISEVMPYVHDAKDEVLSHPFTKTYIVRHGPTSINLGKWMRSSYHEAVWAALHIAYQCFGKEVQELIEALLQSWGLSVNSFKSPVTSLTITSALHFKSIAVDMLIAKLGPIPCVSFYEGKHRELPSHMIQFCDHSIKYAVQGTLSYEMLRIFEDKSSTDLSLVPAIKSLLTPQEVVRLLNNEIRHAGLKCTEPVLRFDCSRYPEGTTDVYAVYNVKTQSYEICQEPSLPGPLESSKPQDDKLETSEVSSLASKCVSLGAEFVGIKDDKVVIRINSLGVDGGEMLLFLERDAVPVEWLSGV